MIKNHHSTHRGLTLLAGVLFLGGAVALSMASEPASEAVPEPAPRVRTDTVTTWEEDSRLRFAGTVRAADRAGLAFEVSGRLAQRRVDVGDPVRAGEILARLDVRELENAEAQAEAALTEIDARLEQRRRDLARVERLLAAKAATREELEQVEAGVRALEASRSGAVSRLSEARRRLGEGVLTAPYDGAVTEILAEPGEYLPVGRPVLRLAGDGLREVEVGIPESLLDAISVDQEVTVELSFSGVTLSGIVHSVGRSSAGAGHLFPVVVRLPENASAAPGATAEVLLARPAGSGLAVPLAAIVDPGGGSPSVFAVRRSRAVRVPVQVGDVVGERVTVVADLAVGEPVVVAGQASLTPGTTLEAVTVASAPSTGGTQ